MFDTMTVTKAASGVLGAFLVLLLAKWAAEGIYQTGTHGAASYVVETETDAPATDEPEMSFEEMLASADIGKGAKVFKKCQACHKIEPGANATGPSLFGVVGRQVASIGDFGYSSSMSEHGGAWTPEELDHFLTKPSDAVPGTAMSFAGLKKQADRVNVIAYLDSLDN
ncbi:c-type cytochrome [Pseudodonghicola flavimaris]|uniref:Cytochrome c family protein n=1 Tax=Pseudodonghicola flavimaris TaxID=3050036 RepID=A0ABT7EXC8_9RHOB|nr:cytochrome c family protein [Pseudodonghicola flavimaris]MDK3017002.1 cytochrome c family protein [Pseudodonghicola flavimaris]